MFMLVMVLEQQNLNAFNIYIPETNSSCCKKWSKKEKIYIFVGSLAVCSLITIIISILVAFSSNTLNYASPVEPCPIVSEPDAKFVPREDWGGVEPVNITSISPAVLVVIKHTGGPLCKKICACSTRVREIQKKDMEANNMPDIRYNFLIGGDGKIYKGRSWAVQNEGRNDTLDIAFIGNFSENIPSRTMVKLAKIIIEMAPLWKALNYSNYKVINHNQTEVTDSPGKNLFKEVITWQRYSDGIYLTDLF